MDRKLRRCCHTALPLLLLATSLVGQARPTNNPSPYPPMANTPSSTSRNSVDPNLTRSPFDPPSSSSLDPSFSHRQMVARRDEVKRRMSENAARLLTLTRDLQADLQGREATPEDAKRLDEIAKLAHTVRDQMRQ